MKSLNPYSANKWLLCALPVLALCLIIACSDDDKKDNPIIPDSLSITSFSPSQGEAGTEITVIGTGFSTVSSENTVTLGTTPVTLNLAEAGKLKFNVPEGASSGTVSVTTNGVKVTSTSTFEVVVPEPILEILDYDPKEGEWDTYVVIEGNNFAPANNVVLFNGVMAEVFQESPSQITVTVPENSRSGKIEVRDPIDDRSAITADDFTVFHGRWTQIADFGGEKSSLSVAFTISGKGYVVMSGEEPSTDVWSYTPETNKWEIEPNQFGGIARYSAVGFVIEDEAYVGSGRRNNLNWGDFWNFKSGVWSTVNTFPEGDRWWAVGFSNGNKGFVGTGFNGDNMESKDFWEYDPLDNLWTQKADFGGAARFSAAGFVIGEKGYIGTGYGGNSGFSDFWEYDISEDKWLKRANVGGEEGSLRSNAVGFELNGKGYIGLGIDEAENRLKDFWEYDPDNDKWVGIADFKGDARTGASVFVIDGKAYVGLGNSDDDELKDFWVFDPGN
ncbi:IPT/TIG domain-containing protein [Flagellimonas flava]|uniref:IPT/TIG domain-containing protein n=1 Tax=Flagellimonas flava TaxID=570519 RepID=UPI003D6601D9